MLRTIRNIPGCAFSFGNIADNLEMGKILEYNGTVCLKKRTKTKSDSMEPLFGVLIREGCQTARNGVCNGSVKKFF